MDDATLPIVAEPQNDSDCGTTDRPDHFLWDIHLQGDEETVFVEM